MEGLQVSCLSRTFAGRRFGLRRHPVAALTDVSFHVESGEVFGIVGHSGSGKSTLARLLVALDRPTSGTVAFGGADIFRLGAAELRRLRSRIQLVFQDPLTSADPRWTARQAIEEALEVRRARKPAGAGGTEALDALLNVVCLDSAVIARRPHALSGGERQRVALARALAVDPDVLVLDEAFSALDTVTRRDVLLGLMAWKRARGATLVLISHDLRLVASIADRALLLDGGRVAATGAAREILARARISTARPRASQQEPQVP